jgi:hypothetical protein
MEKKPECTSMFKSVTKSNVLYPAVALFVEIMQSGIEINVVLLMYLGILE